MRTPTSAIGNGTFVQNRVVSTAPCHLAGVTGYNQTGDLFIQIHETDEEPSAGAVPKFSFPSFVNLPYTFALPRAVDLDKCTIVASSTADTYTSYAGTPVTIQAILEY